jgi:ADP-ribose pyrophosphatase YjhB (NUDIX family)
MIRIYNTAKAVIQSGCQILMLKKHYEDGRTTYTLPGGGQKPGESLDRAVVREVYEEAAAVVTPIRLIRVHEYLRPSGTAPDAVKHKVEFVFLCALKAPYVPRMGAHPDPHQVAVLWMAPDSIDSVHLDPPALKKILGALPEISSQIYLGGIASAGR